MRLAILTTALILASCGQPPVANETELVVAPNEVEPTEPGPPSDSNYVAIADDDPGQTKSTLHICDFGGWSADKDPKGLNVRAEPSATARIVRTLPAPGYDKEMDRDMAPEFDVFEARDGWFRIGVLDPGDARHPKPVYWGWVHGSKIDFAVQSDIAFTQPDPASQPAAMAWIDKEGAIRSFNYRHPVDCKGHWVQLTVSGRDGRERLGWTRGVCEIQETTCDGGSHHVRSDMLTREQIERQQR